MIEISASHDGQPPRRHGVGFLRADITPAPPWPASTVPLQNFVFLAPYCMPAVMLLLSYFCQHLDIAVATRDIHAAAATIVADICWHWYVTRRLIAPLIIWPTGHVLRREIIQPANTPLMGIDWRRTLLQKCSRCRHRGDRPSRPTSRFDAQRALHATPPARLMRVAEASSICTGFAAAMPASIGFMKYFVSILHAESGDTPCADAIL